MMRSRCSHEAKRTLSSPCAEGTLHRAKPCFIFPAPQVRFISQKKSTALAVLFFLEVTIGFEPMDNGVADRGLTTWLRHHINQPSSFENDLYIILLPFRVAYLQKLRVRQYLAYPFWSGLRGSNPPPPPWQGGALPNELNPRNMVPPVGIEPTTRGFSVLCSTN